MPRRPSAETNAAAHSVYAGAGAGERLAECGPLDLGLHAERKPLEARVRRVEVGRRVVALVMTALGAGRHVGAAINGLIKKKEVGGPGGPPAP